MSIKNNSPQLALPIALDDKASFDNFLVTEHAELIAALRASILNYQVDESDSVRSEHKVIYFYGASGSGKSHLMFAIQRLAKQFSQASYYLSLADERVSIEWLNSIDGAAIVCVDDLQTWAGDDAKERELFALFERVKNNHGRLLVSATQPPDFCNFSLKDLVSRLGSGLVYPLNALNNTQQFVAVQLRAKQRGLSISDESVKYLLNRSSRDNNVLFALLDKIDKASLVEKRRITIPFLQSLLGS